MLFSSTAGSNPNVVTDAEDDVDVDVMTFVSGGASVTACSRLDVSRTMRVPRNEETQPAHRAAARNAAFTMV